MYALIAEYNEARAAGDEEAMAAAEKKYTDYIRHGSEATPMSWLNTPSPLSLWEKSLPLRPHHPQHHPHQHEDDQGKAAPQRQFRPP